MQSILDTQELTEAQRTALNYTDGDVELCNAFYWLNFNRFIEINPVTQAMTVKG